MPAKEKRASFWDEWKRLLTENIKASYISDKLSLLLEFVIEAKEKRDESCLALIIQELVLENIASSPRKMDTNRSELFLKMVWYFLETHQTKISEKWWSNVANQYFEQDKDVLGYFVLNHFGLPYSSLDCSETGRILSRFITEWQKVLDSYGSVWQLSYALEKFMDSPSAVVSNIFRRKEEGRDFEFLKPIVSCLGKVGLQCVQYVENWP